MLNSNSRNEWIDWTFSKKNPSLRLFCFPYAGGSGQAFHAWNNKLPGSVELCPIQLPGRGSRFLISPYRDIAPLLTSLAEAIIPALDRPSIFFGHSMGGIIAYELAQQIKQRHSFLLRHLFVSGCSAPHIKSSDTPIFNLPDSEFIEKLRIFNGTPEKVLEDQNLLELFLPILRADFELIETYRHRTHKGETHFPLECPITAIGGLYDPKVKSDDVKAWGEYTADNFSVHMLPGDHFFIKSCESALLQIMFRRLHSHSSSKALVSG